MKRNKCWLILLTLMVLMLTACGGQITQGEVVEKNFTPAHSQVVMIPIVLKWKDDIYNCRSNGASLL